MKVIMYPAITLDGFIADLNGQCYDWINDEDETDYDEAIASAGSVLVGRKTYDQYLEDFPKSHAITFVYTHETKQTDQDKIKFVRGTPGEVIEQIESFGLTELIISGGGEVNGAFAEAGLVDEIRVSIYNVTLGEGIPLFGAHKPKLQLKLLATTPGPSGIIKNHYQVIKPQSEKK
jgi:dihydrofolate reductase